jgi:Excalibur calcium-binding domain
MQTIGVLLGLAAMFAFVIAVIGVLFGRVPFTKLRGRGKWAGVMVGSVIGFALGGSILSSNSSNTPQISQNSTPSTNQALQTSQLGATKARKNEPSNTKPSRYRVEITGLPSTTVTQLLAPDGHEIARDKGSVASFLVKPGVYLFKSSASAFKSIKQRIEVRQNRSLNLKLEPDLISITVTSNLPNTSYRVLNSDGRVVSSGRGSRVVFQVLRGRYKVVSSAPGYITASSWTTGSVVAARLERVAKPQARVLIKPQTVREEPVQDAYFQNCRELRQVYTCGVSSAHPAYRSGLDRDHDDWACECKGN